MAALFKNTQANAKNLLQFLSLWQLFHKGKSVDLNTIQKEITIEFEFHWQFEQFITKVFQSYILLSVSE